MTHASSEERSPKYMLEPLHTLPLLVFEGGLIAVNWIYCILEYTHTHGYTHVFLRLRTASQIVSCNASEACVQSV